MGDVTIEQFGGFVGPGGPGSHIRTRGRVAWSSLSPADRDQVDKVFAAKRPVDANLHYRLTRDGESVDALPDDVPAALRDSVKTELD